MIECTERLTATPVQRMGRFTLARFIPAFNPDTRNHIGETITDETGQLAYLKTFRIRRAAHGDHPAPRP